MINVASYHGFGGAFAVATKNVGMDLRYVVEPEGFGSDAVDANRAFLNYYGPIVKEKDPGYVPDIQMVIGNPPCSGFSGLNTSKTANFRGARSPINQCMWDLVSWAVQLEPEMIIFESVQGAGKQGREVMRELLEYIRDHSVHGNQWRLTNVFMSGASVGAAQVRKRYFFVAHRIRFGVEPPVIDRVTTYRDAIGDLEGLDLTKEQQPYQKEPSPWAARLRNPAGTVGDMHLGGTSWERRMAAIAPFITIGETQREGIARAIEANQVDESWKGHDLQKVIHGSYFSGAIRIDPEACGRVVTGSGGTPFIHWSEHRTLTVRETARLMGFPDAFDWGFCSVNRAFAYLGKQVPVDSWAWILEWAKQAVLGEAGPWEGVKTGPDWEIDVTHDYKRVYHERSRQQGVDSRSDAWKKAMANRVLAY